MCCVQVAAFYQTRTVLDLQSVLIDKVKEQPLSHLNFYPAFKYPDFMDRGLLYASWRIHGILQSVFCTFFNLIQTRERVL